MFVSSEPDGFHCHCFALISEGGNGDVVVRLWGGAGGGRWGYFGLSLLFVI